MPQTVAAPSSVSERFWPRVLGWCGRFVLALCVAIGASAVWADEAALERGAREDTTPQQRYQTAIREAGGGLKVSLEACRTEASERQACEAQARRRYQADMLRAQALLRDPQARPVNVTGVPIRMHETVMVMRP